MDDMIGEFITETNESLNVLDQELVRLEQDPCNKEILGNIFRVMHTIKGTSGFLGLPKLGSVAHSGENLLSLMRDGELAATPQAVTLILESLDQIKAILDHLEQHGAEPEGDNALLISKLEDFANRKTESSQATPVQDAPQDLSGFFKGDEDLAAMVEAENKSAPTATVPAIAPKQDATEESKQKAIAVGLEVAKQAETKNATSASAGANQSIRVSIDVLESLMQMVSELVLNRNQLLQIVRTNPVVQEIMQSPVQQMSYITSELQEGIMKTRMQPIGSAWAKFPRLIRDLSIDVGKKIDLKMIGEETELDRQLLDMVKDPLTHMVRNSCDHGLEMPADRLAAGKPEAGTVTLSAFHEGGHIIVQISDDGRGLNLDRIKQKAVANGVATQAAIDAMSPAQIMQFIFAAGFSTAEKVTSVSGRGVGMDVVRTNIEKMGGTIEIASEVGKGSTFTIKIPLTLAIVSVLIVESKDQKFAIPQLNVLEMVAVAPDSECRIESINNAPVLRLREKLLPLGSLGEILGLQPTATNWDACQAHVVVCRIGAYDFGLIVDRVHDTEEIVVKPVTERLKALQLYSGNTILGDGSVIMILDPNGIAKNISALNSNTADQKITAVAGAEFVGGNEISFLLFKSGKGAPKAVPLELIARLEEIEVKDIEIAGVDPVVQYRGDLMRLVTLGDFHLPSTTIVNVIVFSYDRKNIGLIVDSIIDIVEAPYDIKLGSKDESCLGSMVIEGKTTDIVDVAKLLADLVEEAINTHGKKGKTKGEISNLLLVEDSPFFRNIAEPFLAAAGYNVITAEHGKEALEIIAKRPNYFHAIITDIEMPVMNGFDFAIECKKSPSASHLPIVAYTASLSPVTAERCKEIGINECILKTDRPRLLTAISSLLNAQEIAA